MHTAQITASQPRRYPSHLTLRRDPSDAPQYERLEDLLKRAGYKETRIFTPERINKDVKTPHAPLESPSRIKPGVSVRRARYQRAASKDAIHNDSTTRSTSGTTSSRQEKRTAILKHLSSFSDLWQVLRREGGLAIGETPDQRARIPQRSIADLRVPHKALSTAVVADHQVSDVNVICRLSSVPRRDSAPTASGGKIPLVLLASSEFRPESGPGIRPKASLSPSPSPSPSPDFEGAESESEVGLEDLIGTRLAQRSIQSLRRHLESGPRTAGEATTWSKTSQLKRRGRLADIRFGEGDG